MESTHCDVTEGPATAQRTLKSEEMRKCGRTQVCVCASEMEVKLQLCVLVLLINVSLAEWQKITVMKGQTLNLHCSIKGQPSNSHVEWRNPDAVKDKRYSIQKLSKSEYIISISNVTFSDGGKYTCSHYLRDVVKKTVDVTVLGMPQIKKTTHDGRTVIKCTAEGNYPPPDISWMFNEGPKFYYSVVPQNIQEDKKYVTISTLIIKPSEKVDTLKCIIRHPALHSKTLIDFIKIKPHRTWLRPNPSLPQTTPAPEEFPTFTSQSSTSDTEETSQLSTSDSENGTVTKFSSVTVQLNTSDNSTILPDLITQNQTSRISNTTNGWASVALTTDISFNQTQRNSTENGFDWERREGTERNTSLLVFLVTCLIVGLLVVVIFIGIKLRRAHIIWKRENDDSNDTSEASSKSKSSHEEKNAQRRRGLTQYVGQEPTVITSVTNPAAMTSTEDIAREQPSPAQVPLQTTAKSNIKETEL